MKRKKIFIIISIMVFICFLIYNFAKLDKLARKFVPLEKCGTFDSLFDDSIYEKIKPITGYTFQKDTFFRYSFNNSYDIIIWKIEKYSDVTNISISKKTKIGNSHFGKYYKMGHNDYIKCTFDTIKNTHLFINLDKNSKIIKQCGDTNIFLWTDKFSFSFPKAKEHTVFDLDGPRDVNILIKKLKNNFILILLISKNSNHFNSNILEDIIKN